MNAKPAIAVGLLAPDNVMTARQAWKLAGNSVHCVAVAAILAEELGDMIGKKLLRHA